MFPMRAKMRRKKPRSMVTLSIGPADCTRDSISTRMPRTLPMLRRGRKTRTARRTVRFPVEASMGMNSMMPST